MHGGPKYSEALSLTWDGRKLAVGRCEDLSLTWNYRFLKLLIQPGVGSPLSGIKQGLLVFKSSFEFLLVSGLAKGFTHAGKAERSLKEWINTETSNCMSMVCRSPCGFQPSTCRCIQVSGCCRVMPAEWVGQSLWISTFMRMTRRQAFTAAFLQHWNWIFIWWKLIVLCTLLFPLCISTSY